jgi:hypothetical protein
MYWLAANFPRQPGERVATAIDSVTTSAGLRSSGRGDRTGDATRSALIVEATVRSGQGKSPVRVGWEASVAGIDRAEGRTTKRALALLVAAVSAWLWPIGIGGRMPVGGDVTQFSIGLMAFLHRALQRGQLPLWNDLWGYGFPGLAESQMGVFYPPHLVLFGLLPTEAAYTASLVLHTFWGALGAYWAGRRLGCSAAGAALGGFAWSTSGFFLIHLSHQWGYTTGSWLPWAWGLAWPMAQGEVSRRERFLLPVVLTLQVLPGHFQLAFCTQVSLMLLAVWAAVPGRGGQRSNWRGALALVVCVAVVFPLSAAQVWPTYRLARLADAQRDFAYLSGFSAAPPLMVSYVAPGLFHQSPLWRPVVWDPLHTAPEEYLGYVGLAPLFLAIGTLRFELRRDPSARALAWIAGVTLLLSMGPYVPGFRWLIHLPGFSFFRAPARWTMTTALALCLLAARGYDRWREWPRPGLFLAKYVFASVLASALAVLVIEGAVTGTERQRSHAIAGAYEWVLERLPWEVDPGLTSLARVLREPQNDLRVRIALAHGGWGRFKNPGPVFVSERQRIYARELGASAVLALALLAIAPLARRPRWFAAGLVVVSAVDLELLGRQRPVFLAPIRPLSAQSAVLARLAEGPRGTRVVDRSTKNLPMIAGVSPVLAYRTLDLPCVVSLTTGLTLTADQPPFEMFGLSAMAAVGADRCVLDPLETLAVSRGNFRPPRWEERETVHDPVLAGWLFDPAWVAEQGRWVDTFTIYRTGRPATRAWLVPLTDAKTAAILNSWSGDAADVLWIVDHSSALATKAPSPEHLEVDIQVAGPAMVVVSQLDDPQWRATWVGPGGERPAEVEPVFGRPGRGAWQGVRAPEPGRWTLRLDYVGRDVQQGMIVSALAWLAGAAAFVRWGRERTANEGEPR